MFRNPNSFFAHEAPLEITKIIFGKIYYNELARCRGVSFAWRELIDSMLFDEVLRSNKEMKVSFYVPVYGKVWNLRENLHCWSFSNNKTFPHYFYRSTAALFENTDAKGCYEIQLSLHDITQKKKQLRIESDPLRYYLLYAIAPHEVISYTPRSGDEVSNPFYELPKSEVNVGSRIK